MTRLLVMGVLVAATSSCVRGVFHESIDPDSLSPVSECQDIPRVWVHPTPPDNISEILARAGLVSASTVIVVNVGFDGRVESASVLRSSGFDALDSSALNAARRVVFHPVVKNGEQVACESELVYTFQRRD